MCNMSVSRRLCSNSLICIFVDSNSGNYALAYPLMSWRLRCSTNVGIKCRNWGG